MANFESGVKGFVRASAVIHVNFPIDWKGNESVCCMQCPYLSSNERMCQLNKRPVQYPTRNVGFDCPLENFIRDGDINE